MRNDRFLNSKSNVTFDEILAMNPEQFRSWVIKMRKTVVYLWDKFLLPPRVGFTEEQMIEQFREMGTFPVHEFLVEDQLTGNTDVIRNTSIVGNAVNDFMPTMMKTRINYSKDVNAGKSIYDWFSDDTLLDRFMKYAKRHFKRDSFYAYSNPVKVLDKECFGELPIAKTAKEWIEEFEDGYRAAGIYDYWIQVKEKEEYTGYNEDLKNAKYLELSEILDCIPAHCLTNVDREEFEKTKNAHIRVYRKGQKLFPVGLKAFRVSFCQTAVNFPPLTAKFIYERYTNDFKSEKPIVVWDPSSGWGGRLLGCMAVKSDRQLLYIGNDPNTDHGPAEATRYHEIEYFYRENVRRGGVFNKPHNKMLFKQCGSEVMQFDSDFQQYRGKVSLVFTSPPYFSKEKYSEDPAQSCIKFDQYESWVDGFLEPTLKTAVEWLRPGGYIAWNIADALFDGDMLPLEGDSKCILESLGMKHVETLKMALAQSPGGNRLDPETGLPRAKNFCKVNGIWLKYEPIFVYRKPL